MLERIIKQLKNQIQFVAIGDCYTDGYNNGIDDAINIIETENNSGWIPCNERLPDYCDKVLLSLKDNRVIWGVKSMNEFYDGNDKVLWEDITAWQLLPNPYTPNKN